MAMAEQARGGSKSNPTGKQEREILNQHSAIGKVAHYFTTINKPLLLFPAQFLCSFLLVLFPVVLHLIYTVTTGHCEVNTLLSDFNFLSDWSDFMVMTAPRPSSISTAGHMLRLTGISVHILAASLMWPLCTHVAASCLLGANPPLSQSLKAALRAWGRVLATPLPFILLILFVGLSRLLIWLMFGAQVPPKSDEGDSVGIMLSVSLNILLVIYLNSLTCFCLVIVSLEPDKEDEHFVKKAFKYSKYTRGWHLMLFLLHLQFYVPHLNYEKFGRDFKGGNVVPVALALMNICAMAFVKVYIVIFLCALYIHRRGVHVDSMELEPRKEMAFAKIFSPFVADNKATILGLMADLDESLTADFSEHCSAGGGESYQTFPRNDVSQTV